MKNEKIIDMNKEIDDKKFIFLCDYTQNERSSLKYQYKNDIIKNNGDSSFMWVSPISMCHNIKGKKLHCNKSIMLFDKNHKESALKAFLERFGDGISYQYIKQIMSVFRIKTKSVYDVLEKEKCDTDT